MEAEARPGLSGLVCFSFGCDAAVEDERESQHQVADLASCLHPVDVPKPSSLQLIAADASGDCEIRQLRRRMGLLPIRTRCGQHERSAWSALPVSSSEAEQRQGGRRQEALLAFNL